MASLNHTDQSPHAPDQGCTSPLHPTIQLVPGLNMPLNFEPEYTFGTALSLHGREEDEGVVLPFTTLREFTMLQIMNEISDKPGWETKIFDEEITTKWKAEAVAAEGRDVSEKMMDWVIDELQDKVGVLKETGMISIYTGDVVKSDGAIPAYLKEQLKAAVKNLEDVPDSFKDWHPGSDGKVLDLVHPSLFPLVYGRSQVLRDRVIGLEECLSAAGEGEVIAVRPEEEKEREREVVFSNQFQWLPCDVEIPLDSNNTKIISYINNLHPHHHRDLYSIIEKIITIAIPQWNRTLTPIKHKRGPPRIDYTGPSYYFEELGTNPPWVREEQDDADSDHSSVYPEWEEETEWRRSNVKQPEPKIFKPSPSHDPYIDLRKEYGGRGLQIIVKLANIELTPQKPRYDGGTWHVEGQLNEHIVATALYYYDSNNITESRLGFRQQCEDPFDDRDAIEYSQHEHEFLPVVFGVENQGSTVQTIGDVVCREDRMLTFPNILQHRVHPFELADSSKPGHRKILALFLVDPTIRIISTANVPPQQQDWWRERVANLGVLDSLAPELKDNIFAHVDFPYGIEEAKQLREELMNERGPFVDLHNRNFLNREFFLCEH